MGVLTPVLCLRFCAGHVPAATAMSFSWTRTAALCGAFIAVDRKNRSGGGFVRGWHVSMLIDEAACVCRETYIYNILYNLYIIYVIYISRPYPAVCLLRAGRVSSSEWHRGLIHVCIPNQVERVLAVFRPTPSPHPHTPTPQPPPPPHHRPTRKETIDVYALYLTRAA